MRKILFITVLGLLAWVIIPKFLSAQQAPAKSDLMKAMTFNIRYANPGDKQYAWSERKSFVANTIRLHSPDVVGIQEGLLKQVQYLNQQLKNYTYTGVGRDDGKKAGEFSAIFYRKDILQLLDEGTFWLSQEPDKPGSKSWGTSITRICSYAKFRNKDTGIEFYHFNTHWDHQSANARKNSAKLIARKAKAIAGDNLVLLTGDMNATRDKKPYKILLDKGFIDTRNSAEHGHTGPDYTWVGFPYKPHPGRVIDYVMVKNQPSRIHTFLHATLTLHKNGYYPSDHLPVLTLFQVAE